MFYLPHTLWTDQTSGIFLSLLTAFQVYEFLPEIHHVHVPVPQLVSVKKIRVVFPDLRIYKNCLKATETFN